MKSNRSAFTLGALVVLMSLIPFVFLCLVNVKIYQAYLTDGRIARSYEAMAVEVEAGNQTNDQIAEKFRQLAEGDRKVESGTKKIIRAHYSFIVAFVAISIIQIEVLRKIWILGKNRNKGKNE